MNPNPYIINYKNQTESNDILIELYDHNSVYAHEFMGESIVSLIKYLENPG